MKIKFPLAGATVICGVAFGAFLMRRHDKDVEDAKQNRINVLSDHFQLLNHWLEIKNEGKSVASYFEEHGYYNIAVYGMSDLANRLLEDLEKSSISVQYGIDKEVSCSVGRINEVYFPEDELPKADVIVVTPYSMFEMIEELLAEKVACPVI